MYIFKVSSTVVVCIRSYHHLPIDWTTLIHTTIKTYYWV